VVPGKGTPFVVFNEKVKVLMNLFDKLPFQQALVFTNDKARYASSVPARADDHDVLSVGSQWTAIG
jgi:hypothetical protein